MYLSNDDGSNFHIIKYFQLESRLLKPQVRFHAKFSGFSFLPARDS